MKLLMAKWMPGVIAQPHEAKNRLRGPQSPQREDSLGHENVPADVRGREGDGGVLAPPAPLEVIPPGMAGLPDPHPPPPKTMRYATGASITLSRQVDALQFGATVSAFLPSILAKDQLG